MTPHRLNVETVQALPHIRYEIEQMAKDLDWYYFDASGAPTAVFEAFLLHARNLMELFDGGKGSGLVRAQHFYQGGVCPGSKTRVVSKTTRTLLNNELAHITYWRAKNTKRSGDTKADWPPVQFLKLFEACRDFADQIADCDQSGLPPEESSAEWKKVADRVGKSAALIVAY